MQNPGFFNFFFIFQQFTRFTGSGFNNAFGFWFYMPVLLVGFFPWSVPFLFGIKQGVGRILNTSRSSQTALFFWLWLLLILGFFSIPESKIVGYILPVLPAMALLSAAFLVRRLETARETKEYFWPFFVVALVALLAGLAILFSADQLPQKQLALGIKPYFLAIGAVLAVGGITMFVLSLLRKPGPVLATAAVLGALFSVSLLALVGPISSAQSIKPLALLVKEKIQPGDVVVSYEDYYPDLGIYLQWPEPIVVVTDWKNEDLPKVDNWRSEFYFGFPDTEGEEAWMIDPQAFAQRLAAMAADKSVYLFSTEGSASQLEATFALHTLATQNGIALLSNRLPDN